MSKFTLKPRVIGNNPSMYQIAHAAGWDAGNAHAKEHGRTTWNRDDYNAAIKEMNRILGDIPMR